MQAVLLDVMDVLYVDPAAVREARAAYRAAVFTDWLARRHIAPAHVPVEEACRSLQQTLIEQADRAFTPQEVGQQLAVALLGKRLSRENCEELAEIWSTTAQKHPPRPLPAANDVLGLMWDVVRIGVIGPARDLGGTAWREVLRADGLAGSIHHQIWADEILIALPELRPLLYALASLDVAPQAAAFVSAHGPSLAAAASLGLACVAVGSVEMRPEAGESIRSVAELPGAIVRLRGRTALRPPLS